MSNRLEPLESRRLLSGGYAIDSWTHDVVAGHELQFSLALAPDGSSYGAGYHDPGAASPSRGYVVKFNPAGQPDPAFGQQGVAWMPMLSELHDLVVQPDGRVVVSGQLPDAEGIHNMGFLARLRADGSLDPTFGASGDGLVRRPFGFGGTGALHVRPDGDLVTVVDSPLDRSPRGISVRRYDSNGHLRADFAGGGAALLDLPGRDVLRSAAIAPDGHVAITGFLSEAGQPIPNPGQRVFVAMLTEDGRPDASFGDAGVVIDDQHRWSDTIGVDAQRRVYLVGEFNTLMRYRPDGTLDTTFGDGGHVRLSRGTFEPVVLRVGASGRVVVGGIDDADPTSYALRFLAFDGAGSPDRTFGDDGEIRPAHGVQANFLAMEMNDGTIIVHDEVQPPPGSNSIYAYTRIRGDILPGGASAADSRHPRAAAVLPAGFADIEELLGDEDEQEN